MKHLIIKALHRDESFLAKACERMVGHLQELGAQVVERDLYNNNFNPVLTTSDFQALKKGELPADIVKEQQYITAADYVWVVFPIWWTSMPAILKGYIDRVFLSGFAYTMQDDRPVGLLNSKKVILVNSMGMSYEEYEQTGMFEALKLTIDKGVFEFTGMEIIAHKYFTSIMSAGAEQREQHFTDLLELATSIEENSQMKQEKTKQEYRNIAWRS